jgi:hypothetical protein
MHIKSAFINRHACAGISILDGTFIITNLTTIHIKSAVRNQHACSPFHIRMRNRTVAFTIRQSQCTAFINFKNISCTLHINIVTI